MAADSLPPPGLLVDPETLDTLAARDRILHTAHDLFYRDGIRATGIDRVIAESRVTKVTFYRHFPSKNDLIIQYLQLRHERWMAWFTDALQRHGGAGAGGAGVSALTETLREWLASPNFRGCAFLNSVSEMGTSLPEAVTLTAQHKDEMRSAIQALLPASPQRKRMAAALALAVDGAIVQTQFSGDSHEPLRQLKWLGERIVST
jgi:AcrR family transcriptional regulator